jgi:diguanylate cyclase (GGDEF)-like protein
MLAPNFADEAGVRRARVSAFSEHLREPMISIKKYLDSDHLSSEPEPEPEEKGTVRAALSAYGSALVEMGNCSLDACPGLGSDLKDHLANLKAGLGVTIGAKALSTTEASVKEELGAWGRQSAKHYQSKAREVKELLLVMARTAESLGARDQRCAGQIESVTTRLKEIGSLEDLTEIRASIERSAVELKSSIDRMNEEGKAALDEMKTRVSTYQAKLEEAEKIAFRDGLTGLRSRLCVETVIEDRIASGARFCVAISDLNGFKAVNDQYGHVTGDELLKQFAAELRSACRSTDAIGRWGGDEFMLVFDGSLKDAEQQIERVRRWVCGNYELRAPSGPVKLRVDASIGLAEHKQGELLNDLVARADERMYAEKSTARKIGPAAGADGRERVATAR